MEWAAQKRWGNLAMLIKSFLTTALRPDVAMMSLWPEPCLSLVGVASCRVPQRSRSTRHRNKDEKDAKDVELRP